MDVRPQVSFSEWELRSLEKALVCYVHVLAERNAWLSTKSDYLEEEVVKLREKISTTLKAWDDFYQVKKAADAVNS